jgi:hypothetical protein
MPAQPGVAFPPVGMAGRPPAAPVAPPLYGMPTQPASMGARPPVMPAPPSTPLNMPAMYTPAARAPQNVTLYIILGALFLVALFLVVFFALRS